MSSMLVIGIYTPFLAISLVITLLMLLRTNRNKMDNLFIVICFLLLGWFGVELLKHIFYIPSIARILQIAFMAFLAFLPPNILLLSVAFHKRNFGRYKKLIYFSIFLFPAVTTIMVLTSNYHPFILKTFDILTFWPVQDMIIEWGFWFWVHSFSSYAIMLVCIVFVMSEYLKMPKVYRRPALMIIIAMFITAVSSVFKILNFFPATIDPTIIGSSISLIFFFVGVVNNNQIVFIGLSREAIFQFINDFLIVLDAHGYVADSNLAAREWFASRNLKPSIYKFDDLLVQLMQQGAVIEPMQNSEHSDEGIDIQIPGEPVGKVLNMRRHEMKDPQNHSIGTVVILYDVTHNRLLQERLEINARIDALTGIPNRTAYEGAKLRFDQEEELPLTIVMCDLNGLKKANDTYGHDFGDEFLQVTASVLEKNQPPNSFLARIGGDEFVYLLPKTPLEEGLKLIERVQHDFSTRDRSVYDIFVAMGAACKNSPEEDYGGIFNIADKNMYQDKTRSKKQRK